MVQIDSSVDVDGSLKVYPEIQCQGSTAPGITAN